MKNRILGLAAMAALALAGPALAQGGRLLDLKRPEPALDDVHRPSRRRRAKSHSGTPKASRDGNAAYKAQRAANRARRRREQGK